MAYGLKASSCHPLTCQNSFAYLIDQGYCNGPNVALPTYFTSNIHEAYQRQIKSQFFVTQPLIEPGTHWLKDERANE